MTDNLSILDATLRDGGQGLDDLYNNGFSDKCFTDAAKKKTIALLEDSGVEFIEIGAMGPSSRDRSPFAIYQNIQELSAFLPARRKPGVMYLGLYIGPDTDVNDIPEWNPTLVEGVRVILRYSELQKSLDYCAALSRKGYKVFVQPMLTMRYTDEELEKIIRATNEMGAYACYFVDSYGYMEAKDVQRFFDFYDARLDKSIRIGFHPHNNMNLAFANVKYFANIETRRKRIVDACATGMGQGAGNMQTELLIPFMNDKMDKAYRLEPILDICEYLDKEMIPSNLWGYSVTRLLPAIYKTAYKYGLVMRNKYHLSFRDMNTVLRNMPDDLRNRYTPQNMETALKTLKTEDESIGLHS